MNYTFASIKYAIKNIGFLLPFSILPAVFFAFCLDDAAIGEIVSAFLSGHPGHLEFKTIFFAISLFNYHSIGAFFTGLLGCVLMIFCLSLMMAFIENHMRFGKRTFSGVFSKINDNFLSSCGMCLLYSFIYHLWAVIAAALVHFISHISNPVVVIVFSLLTMGGSQIFMMFICAMFFLWLPCLQITGFRSFEALKYSYQLVSPVIWKITFGQWLSLTIAELLICLCAFAFEGLVLILVATALYVIMVILFCVRMQIAYFNRAGLERADLQKDYYF